MRTLVPSLEVMQGPKDDDAAILQSVRLFHNFIKPHEGLNG
jgi:hypothetical protein